MHFLHTQPHTDVTTNWEDGLQSTQSLKARMGVVAAVAVGGASVQGAGFMPRLAIAWLGAISKTNSNSNWAKLLRAPSKHACLTGASAHAQLDWLTLSLVGSRSA